MNVLNIIKFSLMCKVNQKFEQEDILIGHNLITTTEHSRQQVLVPACS